MNLDFNLDALVAEAKGSLEKYKENKTYNKEVYEELLNKYSSSITVIELLKSEIEKLKKSNLPSKTEIESMGALLNLMGIEKLDAKGIAKIQDITNAFGADEVV